LTDIAMDFLFQPKVFQ